MARNQGSAPLDVIWDSFKAFIRGLVISKDAVNTRARKAEKQRLEQNVQNSLEEFLSTPSAINRRQLAQAKRNLANIYYDKSNSLWQQNRQTIYEESNFTGRLLAWQAKEQAVSNQIL